MVTREDTINAKSQVRSNGIKRLISTAAVFLALCGLHNNANAQENKSNGSDDLPKPGDKKEITVKGHAGIVQPMLMINTNQDGGFTATGATLAMANGSIQKDGWQLSGNSVFLMNGNFNDGKFNTMMTVLNANIKKTLGENSSLELKVGRYMRGQEMHFMNGVQTPQSELYSGLLRKFGDQSDILAMRYTTIIDGVKTFGEIGFAVPGKGGIDMFVNMNDPAARQFVANLGIQGKDVLGIDAISLQAGAKVASDGTTRFSGNLAIKEGKTGTSVSVQDVNPKDGSGLLVVRLIRETDIGTVFVNADGTVKDALGNNINITAGVEKDNFTAGASIGKQNGVPTLGAQVAFKLAPKSGPRGG